MDKEDWGEEYNKLADLYAIKCKEVRELKDKNKQIRTDAIEEFIDKFIKRTQLRKMTKAECINTMYVLADELKEQNK